MWKDPSGLASEKEKHKEKLQDGFHAVEIEINHQSTPIKPGNIFMTIYFPDWCFAETDAGFYDISGPNCLAIMPGSLGGGGGASGGPEFNTHSKYWVGNTLPHFENGILVRGDIGSKTADMTLSNFKLNTKFIYGLGTTPRTVVKEKLLAIKQSNMNFDYYCWPACMQSINDFYGVNPGMSQKQIYKLEDEFRNKMVFDIRNGPPDGSFIQNQVDVLKKLGYKTQGTDRSSFSLNDITTSINDGHPMISYLSAGLNTYGLFNHIVVITGYTIYDDGSYLIHLMNPDKDDRAKRTIDNIDNFIFIDDRGKNHPRLGRVIIPK